MFGRRVEKEEPSFERRVVRGRPVDLRVEGVYGDEVVESESELIDLWMEHYASELFWTLVTETTNGMSSSMQFGGSRVCIEAKLVEE